jgi:hypothetical protein
LSFLAVLVIAPPRVEGACSHLVTSPTDRASLSNLITLSISNLKGQLEQNPVPARPRPCSGAFCSGQPAAPMIPPGWFAERIDPWSRSAIAPAPSSPFSSYRAVMRTVLRSIHRTNAVFHPPRDRGFYA